MRESGVRDVLIYCRDHRCSHHVEVNANGSADDVRLSDIEGQSDLSGRAARPVVPRISAELPDGAERRGAA